MENIILTMLSISILVLSIDVIEWIVDRIEESIGNNQEVCFRGPLTFNLGFEY